MAEGHEPAGLDPYGELFGLLAPLLSDVERARELRRKLVWAYSWAVPNREAVAAIARYSPLIEVGAGTGYWSWLLRQAGADILAFDQAVLAPPHWSPVEKGGPEVIARCHGRTLLLCWPPMDEGFAADCLEQYRGRVLLSVGEKGEHARTGDARFRSLLQAGFVERHELSLPCWPGYSDCLTVYERR